MTVHAVRTAIFTLMFVLSLACVTSQGVRADVFTNVPEATTDGYQLVYSLSIPNISLFNYLPVPYSVNNSASIQSPFDRIAYYLELDNGSGLQYAYASMDAFTNNLSQIGIPTTASGAIFQRYVSNLNVFSNAPGVTSGTGLATGNIEFWPTHYFATNNAGVPNANSTEFDAGDQPAGTGDYGSLQIHNHGADESIISYNRWGGLDSAIGSDLGIGNAPSGNPDWTFAANANGYSVKNLQVLVRTSGISIDDGLERAVFQRNDQNQGTIPLSGAVGGSVSKVEARMVPRAGYGGVATAWQVVDDNPTGGAYTGALTASGGWYDVQVRGLSGSTVVAERTVERIGVGEVFVIAGQSNSANHGSPPLPAADDRVSAFDFNNWKHADDPQPIATGTDGSPWPALGDSLAAELEVPIGFVSVGWGGTNVLQWTPGFPGYPEPLYDRLRDALVALGPDGARAVLWHQGESDNQLNTSTADYVQRLQTVIGQSRIDAGYDIPWGIAQASYLSPSDASDPAIIAAQAQVAAADPLNFVGASTDGFGAAYRWDGIHFNEAGLRVHAQLWFDQLMATHFASMGGSDEQMPEPSTWTLLLLGSVMLCRRRQASHAAGYASMRWPLLKLPAGRLAD